MLCRLRLVTDVSVLSDGLHLEQTGRGWVLGGEDAARFGLVDDYLAYLVDRNYSPRSIRSYGYALLAFCRWLAGERVELAMVTTDVLLRFLAFCRQARVAGRPGPIWRPD